MIRRSPTRIDMRLDDLQEYEEMKKAHETKKDPDRKSSSMNPPVWGGKVPQNEIQERIGYIPQQNPSTHNRSTANEPPDARITQ